jgi:hypothetical protein
MTPSPLIGNGSTRTAAPKPRSLFPMDVWMDGFGKIRLAVRGGRDRLENRRSRERARQMRGRRQEGVQAIVRRQYRTLPERDDDPLFFDRQYRGLCVLRTGWKVGHRGPALPFDDCPLVDPLALRQSPQALLTMLYRSTYRLCRDGAPKENLCHSASFELDDKNAPSRSGIKNLEQRGFSSVHRSLLLQQAQQEGISLAGEYG